MLMCHRTEVKRVLIRIAIFVLMATGLASARHGRSHAEHGNESVREVAAGVPTQSMGTRPKPVLQASHSCRSLPCRRSSQGKAANSCRFFCCSRGFIPSSCPPQTDSSARRQSRCAPARVPGRRSDPALASKSPPRLNRRCRVCNQ